MGLKEIYYGIEDKYYAFIEKLAGMGLNLKPVIGAIESAGIPSLPLFALLFIAILGGAIFATGALSGIMGEGTAFAGGELTLKIQAKDGTPIDGATVELSSTDGEYGDSQDSYDGEVTFSDVPGDKDIEITVTAAGYKELKTKIKAGSNKVPRISLEAKTGDVVKLIITDEDGSPISSASVTYSPGSKIAVTDITGTANLIVPVGSNVIVTITKNGFDPTTTQFTAEYAGYSHMVTLRKPNTRVDAGELANIFERGGSIPDSTDSFADEEIRPESADINEKTTVTITVGDGTNFIQDAKVTLFKDGTNDLLIQTTTNQAGIATLPDMPRGVKAYPIVEKEGYIRNIGESRTITPQLNLTVTLASIIPHVNAINYTIYLQDANNSQAANFQADVYAIEPGTNKYLLSEPIKAQPRNGKVTAELKNIQVGQYMYFAIYAKASNYIRTATDPLTIIPEIENTTITLTKATLENSGTIQAHVINFTNAPIPNANISLFTLDGKYLPPLATTAFDGIAQIDLAPKTQLYVNASLEIYDGVLQTGEFANFTPDETIIRIVPKASHVIFTAHPYGAQNNEKLNNVEFTVYYNDANGNRIKAHEKPCITGQTDVPNLNRQRGSIQNGDLQLDMSPARPIAGQCSINLVSGVTYDVFAIAPGFVASTSQITVTLEGIEHGSQTHDISLFSANDPSLLTFQGIFLENTPEGNLGQEYNVTDKNLVVGEVYEAKFNINMPLSANKVGLYFRTGDKPGLTDDSVVILDDFIKYQKEATKFTKEGFKLKAATSYLPNQCADYVYADQFGLYKWQEFQIPRKSLNAAEAYVRDRLHAGIVTKVENENQNLINAINNGDETAQKTAQAQLDALVKQEEELRLDNLNETDLLDLLAESQTNVISIQLSVPFMILDRNNKNITFSYRAYAQTGNVYTRFPEDPRLGTEREAQGKKECEAATLNFTNRIDQSTTKVVNCNSNACMTLAFEQYGGSKLLKEPDLLTGDDTVYDVYPAVTNETTFPKQLNLTYHIRDFMPNFDDGRLLEFQPDAAYLPIDTITTLKTVSLEGSPAAPVPIGETRPEFPQATAALNRYVNLIKSKHAIESVIINPTLLASPKVPVAFKYADRVSLNTNIKMRGPPKPTTALAALPQGYVINYEPTNGTFTLAYEDGTPANTIDLTVDAILPADAMFLRMNFSDNDPQEYNVQLYDDTGCFELLQNPTTELKLPTEYAAYGNNLMLIKYDASTQLNPKSPTGECAAYSANPNRIGHALAALNIKHLASPANISIILHATPNVKPELGDGVSLLAEPQEIPGAKNPAVAALLPNAWDEMLKTGKGNIAEYQNEYAALIIQDRVWTEEGILDYKLAESYIHVLINNRQYSRDGVISVMRSDSCGNDPLCKTGKKFVDRGDFWVKIPVQSTRAFTSQKTTLHDEVLAFDANKLPLTSFERTYRLQQGVRASQTAQDGRTESPTARNDDINGPVNLTTNKAGDYITAVLPTRRFSVANGDGSEIQVLRGKKETSSTGANVGSVGLIGLSTAGIGLAPVGSVIAAGIITGGVGISGWGNAGQTVGPQEKTVRLVENQAESMVGTEDETVALLHNTAFKRRSCDRGCEFARWPLTAFLPKETQPVSKVHLTGDLWTGTFGNGKVDFAFYGVTAATQCEEEARGQEGIYDYYWAFSNLEDGSSSIQTANAEPMKLTPNDYIATSCSTEQQLCGKISFGGGQCINNCGDGWYYGATTGTTGKLCDGKASFKVTSFYKEGSQLQMLGKTVDDIAESISKCYATQFMSIYASCSIATASGVGAVASVGVGIATEEATAVVYDKLLAENRVRPLERADIVNPDKFTPQTFPSMFKTWQKVCSYTRYANDAIALYKAYNFGIVPNHCTASAFELAAQRCLCLTGTGTQITGCWLTKAFTSALTNDASRNQLQSISTDLKNYKKDEKTAQQTTATNTAGLLPQPKRTDLTRYNRALEAQQKAIQNLPEGYTQKDGKIYTSKGSEVRAVDVSGNIEYHLFKNGVEQQVGTSAVVVSEPAVVNFYDAQNRVQVEKGALSSVDTFATAGKIAEYRSALDVQSTTTNPTLDKFISERDDAADKRAQQYRDLQLPEKPVSAVTQTVSSGPYTGAIITYGLDGSIEAVNPGTSKTEFTFAELAALQKVKDNYRTAQEKVDSEKSTPTGVVVSKNAKLVALKTDDEINKLAAAYSPTSNNEEVAAKEAALTAARASGNLDDIAKAEADLKLAKAQAALNAQVDASSEEAIKTAQAEQEQKKVADDQAKAICGGNEGRDLTECKKALADPATQSQLDFLNTVQNVEDYACTYPFIVLGAQRLAGGLIYNPPDRVHIAVINSDEQKDSGIERLGGYFLDETKGEVDCQQSDLLPTGPDADKDYVWNDWEASRLRVYADGKRRECMDYKAVQALIPKQSDLDVNDQIVRKIYITSRG